MGLASEPEAVEENKRGDRSPDNSGCGWDISFSLGDAVSRLPSHRPCKGSKQTRPQRISQPMGRCSSMTTLNSLVSGCCCNDVSPCLTQAKDFHANVPCACQKALAMGVGA